MTVQHGTPAGGAASGTGLADVIDTILDKGLVIDAFVRVSLVGIEVLTIDARVVVASVDTYLRFAEAAGRLDLSSTEQGLPEVVQGMTQAKAVDQGEPALEAGGDEADDLQTDEPEPARARRREDR